MSALTSYGRAAARGYVRAVPMPAIARIRAQGAITSVSFGTSGVS